MTFEEITNKIITCTKCDLCKERTNAVPGAGNDHADILFIGEAPGRNEDLQGKPFIGRAGNILSELLTQIGLKREDIFITNIVKCRPPGNRDPTPEEMKACFPYLDEQIYLIQPKVIVPLGRFSMAYIMKKYNIPEESITRAHGKAFHISTLEGNMLVMPMYHPAATIYSPDKINDLKSDFEKLKKLI